MAKTRLYRAMSAVMTSPTAPIFVPLRNTRRNDRTRITVRRKQQQKKSNIVTTNMCIRMTKGRAKSTRVVYVNFE